MSDITTFTNLIDSVGFVGIVLIIFGLIAATNSAIKLIKTLCDNLGIEFKHKKQQALTEQKLQEVSKSLSEIQSNLEKSVSNDADMTQAIKELNLSIKSMQERVNALESATVESLYDLLNAKCNRYLYELHGIPSDERDSFCRIRDAYTACGGNHGMQNKVERCLAELNILETGIIRKKPTSYIEQSSN